MQSPRPRVKLQELCDTRRKAKESSFEATVKKIEAGVR